MDSAPVPVPASPSTKLVSRVRRVPFDRLTASQFWKRATPVASVASKVSVSVPAPPSSRVVAAISAGVRVRKVAVSVPAPRAIGPPMVPPPLQVSRSVPVPETIPAPICPPVTLKMLLPLPKSTKPPIVPPDRFRVSLSCSATTLVSMVPPDMVRMLLPTIRLTRPMRPPVMVTTSPSVKVPTMRPPEMIAMSRSEP